MPKPRQGQLGRIPRRTAWHQAAVALAMGVLD